MSNKTLEQVLEHLLNKEEDKASDLLHTFFVEKGRSIYEELMKADEAVETEVEEAVGGAQDTDLEDEIIADQQEVEEEEMFSEDDSEAEATDDLEAELGADDEGADAEEPAGEEGGDSDVEDAFMDVEDALAALKAEFEKIVGGEEAPAEEPTGDEMPAEESFDPLGESADLIAAPTPVTKEQGAGNTKSGFNGAKPAAEGAEPVKFSGGADEKGRPAPEAKENSAGNVNVVGNKKAPAYSAAKAPAKADAASGKTSPIAGS